MTNHVKSLNEDEVDLRKLFFSLWHGKFYILFFSVFSVFLSSMYLQNAERKYLVEYKLKPVGSSQQKNSFSGLGGLASLAGVQLPESGSDDFKIFKELIFSVEVSGVILENKTLIRKIYANEWNSSLDNFSGPSISKLRAYINNLKRILTGSKEMDYMPPNSRRLAIYISNNISVAESKETGFLTLKSESSNPDMLLSLISNVIKVSDEIMRQRYISFSKEPLTFYKDKLRTARSREHREALAELIGAEEQKLMFAAKGKYFLAEPYIEPSISLHPIAPKPKLILLLSLIFGLLTGSGIVILRSRIVREKK
jgi:LPS O-antigen subunit length determinant protein (WzzB/FepE family)